MSDREREERMRIAGFLGVGLDGDDGHKRVTRTEDFLIYGGSKETHERMQETAIKFEEALEARGKTLQETEPEEALDLLREATENTGN